MDIAIGFVVVIILMIIGMKLFSNLDSSNEKVKPHEEEMLKDMSKGNKFKMRFFKR